MFLGSSVVGQLYGGGDGASAFTPPQTTYPEGNQTVTAAAFGPQGGGAAGGRFAAGHKASWVATAAFVTLFVIWWGLPS
jgi:hypothetical protein